MSDNVSRKQAEQVLDAIKARFKAYLEPLVLDSGTIPGYAAPTLAEPGVQGNGWAVVWEEGPSDWPFVLGGGVSEDEAALLADANVEFGTNMKPAQRPAVKFPAGVHVEPMNHWSVGVYPA